VKLLCPCGYVISDTTDFLPYKASLMPDQDQEAFWDSLSSGLAELMAATRADRREEWLRQNMSGAPLDADDDSLVFHFATSLNHRYTRTVYQCERCGRLFLDDPANKSRVVSFVPDDAAAARGVLASRQNPRK
jgi:predicted RNA-binding Zn ribbon-like protein